MRAHGRLGRFGSLGVIAVVVLILALVLVGIFLLPWRGRMCTGRIVIIGGPRGALLECVCDGGRLGTCFPPGP
jgi:hypothetical protein